MDSGTKIIIGMLSVGVVGVLSSKILTSMGKMDHAQLIEFISTSTIIGSAVVAFVKVLKALATI